jgi:hypothetical protein
MNVLTLNKHSVCVLKPSQNHILNDKRNQYASTSTLNLIGLKSAID